MLPLNISVLYASVIVPRVMCLWQWSSTAAVAWASIGISRMCNRELKISWPAGGVHACTVELA